MPRPDHSQAFKAALGGARGFKAASLRGFMKNNGLSMNKAFAYIRNNHQKKRA
jgi:hypothetical protein